MFDSTISVCGYTYSLTNVVRTSRGWLKAEYYCPASPMSEYVYMNGPFVSESI